MNKLAQWHKTKQGLFTFAVIELALTVLFAEWAIGNGNLLLYLLGIIFLVGFLQNFAKLIWKIVHGNKTSDS